MKYFIISGEASGDLHGSNLIKQLKAKDPNAVFEYWGGDLMQNATGIPPLKHYKDLAFMGFWEVAKHLKTILSNIKLCKQQVKNSSADVVILIDYPGFNLRMAKYIKNLGIKVFYYISPTVWAWKASRVKTIQKYVDEMFVILPFEKPFYEQYHYPVQYLGHPLLDAIHQYQTEFRPDMECFKHKHLLDDRPIIALLPGSRVQEIKSKLPIMLQMINRFPNYQFVVSVAPSIDLNLIKNLIGNQDTKYVVNQTYDLLSYAHAALVTSGTATLETALFKVPQVVCYITSKLSYHIAKSLVDIKYISLVNLILDREVVTELIQDDLNPDRLKLELAQILDSKHRETVAQDYNILQEILGGAGASERIADKMLTLL